MRSPSFRPVRLPATGRRETPDTQAQSRRTHSPWIALALSLSACFGARSLPKTHLELHGEYVSRPENAPTITGFCRVEGLDSESAYDKFQVVVRRSPYELSYSDRHVWAVKPSQMVTEKVARALSDAKIFSSVSSDLGESRPTYSLTGQLQAIELYDSGDVWFAHLSVNLRLVRFSDGQRLWKFAYEHRKPIEPGNFGHGVRALSEMLAEVNSMAAKELAALAYSLPNEPPAAEPDSEAPPAEKAPSVEPVVIPEANLEPEPSE
ncbi:MAG: membrane integrity-associated transporter subunit PqiC [Deltaproteobacteria bacterium]|nr:membrane integrity-associated transporter subunit PqiC [Deltaproteobacteria bacterium]